MAIISVAPRVNAGSIGMLLRIPPYVHFLSAENQAFRYSMIGQDFVLQYLDKRRGVPTLKGIRLNVEIAQRELSDLLRRRGWVPRAVEMEKLTV